MSFPAIGSTNGFRTSAPLCTIAITNENSVAKFSMPQELLTYAPKGNCSVNVFKNCDKERKIHCNVEFPEDEVKLLKELQGLAAEANAVFLPLISVRATRYITTARGDIQRALKMMQATNEFYHQQFGTPCSEKLLEEELKHGIAYWCGRDCELRPTLVFRANRIPNAWHKAQSYDKVVRVVSFCFEYFFRYMSVPGVVESVNVILDLNGLGLTQIPVTALKEMHKNLANHYTVRVTKMYICNMSTFLRGIIAIAKTVITERQSQKLCVVSSVEDLLNDFALHQLEKDYAGSKDNVKESWPFILSPGPFTAGYKGGPNPKAFPYVHEAFAPTEILDRLWDPTLSLEEYTHQTYSKSATSIFRKCGLPVPKGCPLPDEDLQESIASDLETENDPKQNDVENQLNEAENQLSESPEKAEKLISSAHDTDPLNEPLEKAETLISSAHDTDQLNESLEKQPDVLEDEEAPFRCCWFSCRGRKKTHPISSSSGQ